MRTRNLCIILFYTAILLSAQVFTSCNKSESDTEEKEAGVSLGLESVVNLRDMGGYKTKNDQTIRYGKLYRSNQLSGVSTEDMKVLASLDLKNTFDMRSTPERNAFPDELPDGVKYSVLDVLGDSSEGMIFDVLKIFENPEYAHEHFGDGKYERLVESAYRSIINSDTSNECFSILFKTLSKEEELPALFHCVTGKDRTGWVAAAFLSLMEVPREDIYENYLLSNDYIVPLFKSTTDIYLAAGGDEDLIISILGVRRGYLEAAFDEMEKLYGSIENYFTQALKIDAEQQQVIKDRFLINE